MLNGLTAVGADFTIPNQRRYRDTRFPAKVKRVCVCQGRGRVLYILPHPLTAWAGSGLRTPSSSSRLVGIA